MKKFIYTITSISSLFLLLSCGAYSFTGISTDAKSFQVNFFQNNAGSSTGSVFEPGLDRDFTIALQDILQNQTNLEFADSGGEVIYEGEITEYRVSPMSATSQQTAAQNRLTIAVNVRFFNTKNEEQDFERSFSFFFDFPAATQLQTVKAEAHEEIFDRITQDIINASLANW